MNKAWNTNIGTASLILHIKDNLNITSTFNNRLAWLRGFLPANFPTAISRKHKLSSSKLTKIAHSIRKKLIEEFKSNIWLPRCVLYKKWMDSQQTSYKQFCINKQNSSTYRRRTNTSATLQHDISDPFLDDQATTQPTTFNYDHKHRAILTAQDKKTWASNITHSIIKDRINNGIKCKWLCSSSLIKNIVRSRKTIKQTTDIHPTDRDR